ncbi:MAG: hypothetical protein ACE5J0_03355 [Candidatus Paceibacterales bacterium]
MANKSSSKKILEKIEAIEKSLQRLKIETYFGLPKEKQKFFYPEKSLREAIRALRKSIWQERYAKKV